MMGRESRLCPECGDVCMTDEECLLRQKNTRIAALEACNAALVAQVAEMIKAGDALLADDKGADDDS